jgi:hypothetical protein
MKKPFTPADFVKIAREIPSDERVPYAFEKRIMAHLRAAPEVDVMALWARGLWRAAAPCLAVMVVASLVSISFPADTQESEIDLESAVIAPTQSVLDVAL